jgi:hypothetical protein
VRFSDRGELNSTDWLDRRSVPLLVGLFADRAFGAAPDKRGVGILIPAIVVAALLLRRRSRLATADRLAGRRAGGAAPRPAKS